MNESRFFLHRMPRLFCAVEIQFEMRDVIMGGRGKMGTMIPGGSDRGRRADVADVV